MIDYVQSRGEGSVFHQPIGHKDEDQTDIFQRQRPPLTNSMNQRAYALSEKPIEGIVNQKEKRDLRGGVAELFHHQERCEDDKNLPPCTGQKRQQVVEPVATSQNQGLVLCSLGGEVGEI